MSRYLVKQMTSRVCGLDFLGDLIGGVSSANQTWYLLAVTEPVARVDADPSLRTWQLRFGLPRLGTVRRERTFCDAASKAKPWQASTAANQPSLSTAARSSLGIATVTVEPRPLLSVLSFVW